MRNASDQLGENEQSEEKRKLRRKLFVNTYDISSMKRATTAKKCRRK